MFGPDTLAKLSVNLIQVHISKETSMQELSYDYQNVTKVNISNEKKFKQIPQLNRSDTLIVYFINTETS